MSTTPLQLTAHIVGPTEGWVLEPAPPKREWMDDTGGFAYRCLPLTIANQGGWIVRSPATFQAVWTGGDTTADTGVMVHPEHAQFANQILSHFGFGVITFSLPWLFRTPEGYALWVRGPTNTPKHAVAPLDGIVETDWATSTFTMNWKITERDRIVRFEQGEPICMLTPVRLADLERFAPDVRTIDADTELKAAYERWSSSRTDFNADPQRSPSDWQKDYFRGESASGEKAREHRSRLRLRPFSGPDGS
ncbi:MAG: DUF6065 family protein [Phycisphaerales bacterium]